jgi:putative Holliday junction resolvase
VGDGRILAIDYGTKHIGLACSDELRLTVQPLPSLRLISRRDLVARLRPVIKDNDIRELVIGSPLNMDGSPGCLVPQVESLAGTLSREFGLPLQLVDERLSTIEAEELWRGLSTGRKRKYRTIDSLSAALILERYLKE